MLVGWLRDTQGSYAMGFTTLIGLAALGAVAVLMLPRGRNADGEPLAADLTSPGRQPEPV